MVPEQGWDLGLYYSAESDVEGKAGEFGAALQICIIPALPTVGTTPADICNPLQTPPLGQGYVQHFGMLNDTQMAMFDNKFFNLAAEEAC